jgi:hypothetical protein
MPTVYSTDLASFRIRFPLSRSTRAIEKVPSWGLFTQASVEFSPNPIDVELRYALPRFSTQR